MLWVAYGAADALLLAGLGFIVWALFRRSFR